MHGARVTRRQLVKGPNGELIEKEEANYETTRPRHLNTQTPDAVLEGEIPSQCQFKNTLKNGIVVGALESRYDHFVRDEEESEG